MLRKFLLFSAIVSCFAVTGAQALVLDFDGLASAWKLAPDYAGLAWDENVYDFYGGYEGSWFSHNDNSYAMPYDASGYLYNGNGARNIGLMTPFMMSSVSAWFSSVAIRPAPQMVRLVGYTDGVAKYFGDWSVLGTGGSQLSCLFAGNDVTRVNVETLGKGWFAMDHLELNEIQPTAVPEPFSLALFSLGLIGLASRRLGGRQR